MSKLTTTLKYGALSLIETAVLVPLTANLINSGCGTSMEVSQNPFDTNAINETNTRVITSTIALSVVAANTIAAISEIRRDKKLQEKLAKMKANKN